jgi:hypothetical protein
MEIALGDYNAWATFYHYELGVNTFPHISHAKCPPEYMKWKNGSIDYQKNSVSEERFQRWIHFNAFNEGVSILMDRIWRGKYEGYHITTYDADNECAVKMLLRILYKFGPEKYLIESRNGRLHAIVITKNQMNDKSSDNAAVAILEKKLAF